mgnify:CR=1 FL=1
MNKPLLKKGLPGIGTLEAYTTGMRIEELQRRLGLADVIKLASNENPLGPSPKVKAALAAAVKAHKVKVSFFIFVASGLVKAGSRSRAPVTRPFWQIAFLDGGETCTQFRAFQ